MVESHCSHTICTVVRGQVVVGSGLEEGTIYNNSSSKSKSEISKVFSIYYVGLNYLVIFFVNFDNS